MTAISLYNEYHRINAQLKITEDQLSNKNFTTKASAEAIKLANQKCTDFDKKLSDQFQFIYLFLLKKFGDKIWFQHYTQENRHLSINQDFSEQYFETVYNPEIKDSETVELLKIYF